MKKNDITTYKKIPIADVGPKKGLSEKQIKERAENGLLNVTSNTTFKTVPQIFKDNIFTFFNFIFVVLGLFLVLVGSYKDMFFLAVMAANAFIGIVQQLRSKFTLDKLTLITAPSTITVRDGKEQEVKVQDLVRDDVVLFSSGSQICADATVLDGEMQVDESLLTGESDPITKKPGDFLYSGSFVITGKSHCRLDKVGDESFASKLTIEAKQLSGSNVKSEMIRSLDKLIRVIGFVLIPMGLLLFFNQYLFLETPLKESVTSTVAALVGMIPEGFYLLTSIALAVSVIKLIQNDTLVHEMGCIESLARVNTLCVDKTGTITEPEMRVIDLIHISNPLFNKIEITQMLSTVYQELDAENATSKAMQEYFVSSSDWKIESSIPFMSANKWSAVTFKGKGDFFIGGPEMILKEDYSKIKDQVEGYFEQGIRVLLAAYLDGEIVDKKPVGKFVPLSLILLKNPIRDKAVETFEFFAKQDVDIKVISGDNPITVSRVAKEAGIANSDKFIDATTLKTDEEIYEAIKKYTVFGRVSPEQKRKFVRALKSQGKIVGMTGDGVNDVLALKEANVGVAMASGSDAACSAAHLVLLKSDFAAMPKVVLEGRRVINNVELAGSLFLVKNIFSFIMSILTLLFAIPYPLTPFQITLISACTIGAPSLFLAIQPNKNLVKGRFIQNVLSRALPAALSLLLLIMVLQFGCSIYSLPSSGLRTMSSIIMCANGLFYLYTICRPLNWLRAGVLIAMVVGFLFAFFVLGDWFSFVALSLKQWLLVLALIAVNYPLLIILTKIIDKIIDKLFDFAYKIIRKRPIKSKAK